MFARCVSAEVRAQMAAVRITARDLAGRVGFSQNYLSIRLRDERPFTLDDLPRVIEALGYDGEVHEFIADATKRHTDNVWATVPSERDSSAAPSVIDLASKRATAPTGASAEVGEWDELDEVAWGSDVDHSEDTDDYEA